MTVIHLKPIDGVRALTHLCLIFLHSAMVTTAHLPSQGPLWETIRNHWIYTTLQAGGVQVDIMFVVLLLSLLSDLIRFMMSAFLLVYGLISQETVPSFISYSLRRALRLLPSIALLVLAGYLLGDCWELPFREIDHSAPISSRISIILLLINNYFDQPKYGNFTGSLTWSCAADFHMSLVVFLIVVAVRQRTLTENVPKNHLLLAQRLKPVFFGLIVLSLVIRGVIFDKDTRNLLKLVNIQSVSIF
jgi:hypothetical protein